eukprot:4154354-Amphidinium_carterae.1
MSMSVAFDGLQKCIASFVAVSSLPSKRTTVHVVNDCLPMGGCKKTMSVLSLCEGKTATQHGIALKAPSSMPALPPDTVFGHTVTPLHRNLKRGDAVIVLATELKLRAVQ